MIKRTTTLNLLTALIALLTGNILLASEAMPPACPTIVMGGNDVTCYGNSNGSASVQVIAGGSGNYTFTWATTPATITSGGTSSSLSNLTAGMYSVTVRDNVSGCTVVGAFVVGSPDPLEITAIVNDVNCFNQSTGDIDITVTGGTTPRSYSWSNGANTQDLNNVVAGTYTVQVDAPAGCSATRTFTIDQPQEALDATAIVSNVECFNTATGAIDVTVWGGTAPYFYSWDSGQTTEDVSNLTAGNYNLTITDSRGCVFNLPLTVTSPPQLTGNFTLIDPVKCFGEATGNLTYQGAGGTVPYSYSWQNSTTLFSESSGNLNNVVADNYQVTLTDANGCQIIENVTLTGPTLLEATASSINVSCFGGTDGAIDVSITGGVGPYSTVWNNTVPVVVGTNEDLLNIPADTYTATITDNNNCVVVLSQTITQPNAPIAVTTSVTDVLCFGNNTGAINLDVTGGTPPFSFSWSSGQSTEDVDNLLAGAYDFSIQDANGCPFNGSEIVSQPLQPLTVNNIITNVNCYGESNGAINLTVTGGTAPFVFEWSNSTFLLSNTNEDLIDYPADDYSYIVTDANGCMEIDTLTVSEPQELVTSVTGVNILCKGGNNGSVDLTVAGGVIPYIYNWNNGAVTEDIMNLTAGFYEVIVTDDHGCTASDSITLTEPDDSLEFVFAVSHVRCNDGTDGAIDLDISGGTIPYNYNWSSGDTLSTILDLTAGWYTFLVTDNNGCTISDSIEVNEPDAVTLNEDITPVTCFEFSDGIIDITPIGGTPPFNFTWYNSDFALSAQTEDLMDYPADIYQLEIVDSNDCFYEMFLEIVQPELLVIEYDFNVVSCAGGTDGNILVDISGGNPAYTTNWSNGATTQDLLNIPYNTYQLNVTDTKGCSDSIIVDIAQPDSIKIDFETVAVTCIDNDDGIAYAYPNGGNGGYFYNWSNGTQDATNTDLLNEWYAITVTDLLGCTGTDSVFIPKIDDGCITPVTAFTPNGDLYNDTWVISNMDLYPNAEIKIFNKWGNMVHEQTGLYEPWDGTVNGEAAPSALYYWIINLNHPERETLYGNITIVR